MEQKIRIICYIISVFSLLVSCKQSLFEVLTHGGEGYWSRYDNGVALEYSKKDSTVKFFDKWEYRATSPLETSFGIKFRISNDTIFEYIPTPRYNISWDSTHVIEYSKNIICIRSSHHDTITWYRWSNKDIRRWKKKGIIPTKWYGN